MDDYISSKVLKFADDTKVSRKVTNVTDKQSLQDDLDKLVKWSEKWQMLFNFGKCKCIHIGHGHMDEEYKMGDAVLGRTTQEKDLGITFSADMKVSEQSRIAASKGNNKILGLIRRTTTYKEKQRTNLFAVCPFSYVRAASQPLPRSVNELDLMSTTVIWLCKRYLRKNHGFLFVWMCIVANTA